MVGNDKRLHIHSVPLVLFVLAATAVVIVSVNAWRMGPLTEALVRPALRFEPSDHGFVSVTVNRTLPDEPAGVQVEGLPTQQDVMRASQAANSVGLQLVLDNAVK